MAPKKSGKSGSGSRPGRPRAGRRQRSRRAGRRARGEGGGLRYGSGVVGKHVFRIRVRHIADHLAPLISRRALGAAKLDLVLRGIALLPAHAGSRQPGYVLSRYSWQDLHDLARQAETLGTTPPDFDPPPEVVKLKRDWVGDQLSVLEEMGLIRRDFRPGARSRLIVLRDDGSGEPLDDPAGSDVYITIRGDIIASGALARWGAPELSAYLAATVAERYDRATLKANPEPGAGQWFRPLAWFADPDRRFGADARIRIPFSVPTLERGLRRFREEGLITCTKITRDPQTRARLRAPRNLYSNRFHRLGDSTEALDADEYVAEAAEDDVHEAE